MGKVIKGRFRDRRILTPRHSQWKWFVIPMLGLYLITLFEILYLILTLKGNK
jgi:hypothetical protein